MDRHGLGARRVRWVSVSGPAAARGTGAASPSSLAPGPEAEPVGRLCGEREDAGALRVGWGHKGTRRSSSQPCRAWEKGMGKGEGPRPSNPTVPGRLLPARSSVRCPPSRNVRPETSLSIVSRPPGAPGGGAGSSRRPARPRCLPSRPGPATGQHAPRPWRSSEAVRWREQTPRQPGRPPWPVCQTCPARTGSCRQPRPARGAPIGSLLGPRPPPCPYLQGAGVAVDQQTEDGDLDAASACGQSTREVRPGAQARGGGLAPALRGGRVLGPPTPYIF